MPGYINKVRQRFDHKTPHKPQHSPFKPQPQKFGTAAQEPIDDDKTKKVDSERKKLNPTNYWHDPILRQGR
jgi:hypothetical protein